MLDQWRDDKPSRRRSGKKSDKRSKRSWTSRDDESNPVSARHRKNKGDKEKYDTQYLLEMAYEDDTDEDALDGMDDEY